MVVAVIPMAGAATAQNTNIINVNVNQGLSLGLTGTEALKMQNILEDKKPFGANSDKVLAQNNQAQSDPNVLKLGDTGVKVKELQTWLKNYGYYTGAIDGNFGADTEKAVKQFQLEANIKVDGIVGKETQNAMKKWDQMLAQMQASQGNSNTGTTSSQTSYKKRTYTKTYAKRYTHAVRYGYVNGLDCWGMSSLIYGRLTASGQKARIIQYATSMSSRHRTVQVYSSGKWVNYNYSGYSKIYEPTSNSVNGKVVQSS